MLFEGKYLKEYESLRGVIANKYPLIGQPDKDINEFVSKCYNGCGFISYRNEGYKANKKYNGFDLNSAYTSFLLKEKYPLNWKSIWYEEKDKDGYDFQEWLEEMGDDLWVAEMRFINLKPKYNNFDYNIYYSQDCATQIVRVWPDGTFETSAYLTCIDIMTLKTIYTWDEVVVKRGLRFTKCGYMPTALQSTVLLEYNKIQELKREGMIEDAKKKKLMLEILTYGKNAAVDREWYRLTKQKLRNKRVCIAAFQVAYVRRYMAYLFLKYKDSILQVDTDGLILENNVIFEEYDSERQRMLGEFKCEFVDKHVVLVRPKAYIVFDDNKNIYKYKFNGLKKQLSKYQLNTLFKYSYLEVTEDRNFIQEDGSTITKPITFKVDWTYDYNSDELEF